MTKPNLFIVGAPKCGTSSMYYYLAQHPDIYMSERKEPRFFGSDLQLREGWRVTEESEYLNLFSPGANAKYRGEATVFYLYSLKAAEEIRDYCPGAKIIIMLRNPISMLRSLHNHFLVSCNEDLADFQEAIEAQDERLRGDRIPKDVWYRDGLQYTEMASYTKYVQKYYDVFGEKKDVLVVLFDDLKNNTAGQYQRVLEFLEVDSSFQPELEPKNPAPPVSARAIHQFWIRHPKIRHHLSRLVGPSVRRNAMHYLQSILPQGKNQQKPISAEFESELRDFFTPEIKQLGSLLGRNLDHWYQAIETVQQGEKP